MLITSQIVNKETVLNNIQYTIYNIQYTRCIYIYIYIYNFNVDVEILSC